MDGIPCSWKSEFRQWLGDLQPRINVYLFNAEDVAKKDRIQFLRRVSTRVNFGDDCSKMKFSGMKMVEY